METVNKNVTYSTMNIRSCISQWCSGHYGKLHVSIIYFVNIGSECPCTLLCTPSGTTDHLLSEKNM